MGERCQRVWELFVDLTGIDPMDIQKELNPIIKKLKINLNEVQTSDIRRIVLHYLKNSSRNRLKSVAQGEEDSATSGYNHH
jgi:predicted transcriptional regulator